VRVERVTVTGLTTREAPEIRAALTDAGRGMSTLNVDVDRLERAVASHPAVEAVEARADFPHGLTVEVIERRPIAVVSAATGGEVAVAADGTLLPDAGAPESLATLSGADPVTGGRLRDRSELAALAAVTAAPPELARRIASVEHSESGGLLVTLEEGPAIVLGDGSRLEAKWVAAASVIAEAAGADAGYVDVSIPERPAAGG
jgi:cell division protein FtsQ